jgi:hypothetical protein
MLSKGAGVIVSRMDHFFQQIARFSFINVTCKNADESYIPDYAQSIAVAVKHPPGFQKAVGLPILPVWPTQHGGCEDEAFSERFLGTAANEFIGSDGFSHDALLTRQRGAQTAAQSICSDTPSRKT